MATLQDYYNTGDDGERSFSGASWESQTFTAGASYEVTSVKLKCFRGGSGVATVTVAIKATSGGLPTGANLAEATMAYNDLPLSADWVTFTFGSSYSLTSGTKYAIVFYNNQSYDTRWRCDGSSPTYSGGSRVYSINSGSSWTEDTTRDFLFETYEYATTYVEGTGTLNILSSLTGNIVGTYYISGTSTASIVCSLTGILTGTAYKEGTGTLALICYAIGRLSEPTYFDWITLRPPIYDSTKVWDETSKSWVNDDGRGGARFKNSFVFVGQQSDGNSKIYVKI